VKNSKNDELKIFSLNVRSLVKSISHFREEIHEYQKYDVLSFNETNCTEEKLPNGKNDIVLEGFYEPLIQNPNRASGRGGG
jgi:exonuclease III